MTQPKIAPRSTVQDILRKKLFNQSACRRMSEGITNHYIESILKPVCKNYFGVFSANSIPRELLKLKEFSIVCNLSKVGEKGSHFVTIVVKPNFTLYIDSLGLPPFIPEICNFLKQLSHQFFYNPHQIQHSSSKFCGFFCILFVLYFSSPPTTLVFEEKDLFLNDVLCVNKIKEILNKFVY